MQYEVLSEVAEVIDSLHKTPTYSEEGKPMVRCTDVFYGYLDLSKTLRVNDEVFNSFSKRYTPQKNDIIITRVGSYGRLALVKDTNFCLGQNTTAIIPKIDPRYLYFTLNSPFVQNQIESLVVGTTQKTLSLKAISSLNIPRFDTLIEKKISKILGSFDDKIQLNNQINQTLEQMAQALFKSWFVDFDPVKAKIATLENGGSEEEATLAAMSVISGKDEQALVSFKNEQPEKYAELKATAELFPSAMQESELGEIPEGWEVLSLGDSYLIVMGQSPKGDTYNENHEGTMFYQGRAEFGWRYPSPRLFTTSPKKIASEGSILLSVRAPVGDLNVALNTCCIGRGLASLLHNSKSTGFSYYQLKSIKEVFSVFNGEGTVFGSINQKDLKSIKVISPDNSVLMKFVEKISVFDELIMNKSKEIISLTKLRDSLLPKLLSGEISLSETENCFNEAKNV